MGYTLVVLDWQSNATEDVEWSQSDGEKQRSRNKKENKESREKEKVPPTSFNGKTMLIIASSIEEATIFYKGGGN